ncbi:MAG: HaeII family restriction endonuclease [Chloroflexota bacterium]
MPPTLQEAKNRLDEIIQKGRLDFYKPIQIAEVLNRLRLDSTLDVNNITSYRNPSIHWRDEITVRFTGKKSTSSARYQHDVWNPTAMSPEFLSVLDGENERLGGVVERYIYRIYFARQHTIGQIIDYIENTSSQEFELRKLLDFFISDKGLRRSIDKAYEIVSYSLFETVVVALNAIIKLDVPEDRKILLNEFPDLAKVLLGLDKDQLTIQTTAHVYRVGVTNAADRGLDMWTNFGIAIQVKHLTLNNELAVSIIDQIESDNIVIVCTDADAQPIEAITRQIGWGKRVRGIIKESDLIDWYEKCLRGRFANDLTKPLKAQLLFSFRKEFPQTRSFLLNDFFEERNYSGLPEYDFWSFDQD